TFGGLDHGDADAVLNRPNGIKAFQLGGDDGLAVADYAPQPHQGGVADDLGHVVVNLAAERLRKRHGIVLLVFGRLGYPSIVHRWTTMFRGYSRNARGWMSTDQLRPLSCIGAKCRRSKPIWHRIR